MGGGGSDFALQEGGNPRPPFFPLAHVWRTGLNPFLDEETIFLKALSRKKLFLARTCVMKEDPKYLAKKLS